MLVCIVSCEMPDVGAFKVGDKITDPALVAKLTGHPYFEEVKEDK